MGTAYVLTLDAIVRHAIRVDSGGNLFVLDNVPSSPGWWNVLQDAVFVTMGLSGGQIAGSTHGADRPGRHAADGIDAVPATWTMASPGRTLRPDGL